MKNKIIIFLCIFIPMITLLGVEASKNNIEKYKNNYSEKTTSKISRTKVIIYKFYSPLCKDCLIQAKEIEKLKSLLPQGVKIEEVNVSENSIRCDELIKNYNIMVVPTTVIVDNAGKIRKKYTKIVSSDELLQEAEKILKEK